MNHRSFTVGGAPRALAPSIDGSTICVGLRDGGVAIFPADPGLDFPGPTIVPWPSDRGLTSDRSSSVPPSDRQDTADTGVKRWTDTEDSLRAICHVGGEWWLVAKAERSFVWLRVHADRSGEWVKALPDSSHSAGGGSRFPTHIGRLEFHGGVDVLVSYARAYDASDERCSDIYSVTHADHGPPRLSYRATPEQDIGRLRSVTPVHRVFDGEKTWLLVGFTGRIWTLSRTHKGRYKTNQISLTWGGGEAGEGEEREDWAPGLVTDVTGTRDATGAPRNEVILSTDVGAFVMTITVGGLASSRRLDHAGLRGVPLAVACCTSEEKDVPRAYVWCFDSLGGSHLYEARLEKTRTTWHRVQSRIRDAPALQAVAFQPGDRKGSFVIWQNCRDESIGVTRYRTAGDVDDTGDASNDPIGAFQSFHSATQWLSRTYPTAADSEEVLPPETVLADLFDPDKKTAHTLWEFLADPTTTLAEEIITEIASTARGDDERRTRVRESVDLWAQTLVGSIHRHRPAFRDDLALGVIRWLHRLVAWSTTRAAKSGAGSAMQDAARVVARTAEDALFDVRRWTLFAPQSYGGDAVPGSNDLDREPYRSGIAYQLARIDARTLRGDESRRELEEAVVKECILFRHRIDDEAREPQTVRGVAYDVARVTLGGDIAGSPNM